MIQQPNEQQLEVVQLAKVLMNGTRVNMLWLLYSTKMAMASTFTRKLSLTQSNVSRSLKMMVRSGLVKKEKIGSTWVYSIEKEKLALVQLLFA